MSSKSPTAEYLVFNQTHGGFMQCKTLDEARLELAECLASPNWNEGGIYVLVEFTKQIETISLETWTKDQTS